MPSTRALIVGMSNLEKLTIQTMNKNYAVERKTRLCSAIVAEGIFMLFMNADTDN